MVAAEVAAEEEVEAVAEEAEVALTKMKRHQ